MRPYRLAIFDFDGTLADSFPWFLGVLEDLARAHGFKAPSAEERETLRGLPAREIVRRFEIPAWRLPAVAADMRARKVQAAQSIRLFDGVPQALSNLKDRGVVLAIVSSDSEASIRTTMGPTADLISHWSCGADLFGKAAKFSRLRRKTGVAAADTICVGDEDRDALAAGQARLAFGAVAWGFATRQALAARKPALVFNEVGDLVRIAG